MSLAGHMAAVERVREVLEGDIDPEGERRLDTSIHSLVLEHVSYQYEAEGQLILEKVNMDIPIGKKVALVGTSGGGKSTIAQLLIRFYEPDTGQITVNSELLSTIHRDDWLQRLTVVFQDPYLFPDTIRNNLLLGRDISEERMQHVCELMQIHSFIRRSTTANCVSPSFALG